MIETETRRRVGRGIGKSEKEAAIEVFERLRRRGHPEEPPSLVSDGSGEIQEAMVEVYGKVPRYGGRGRPPKKKRAQGGWRYLQVVKEREGGKIVGTSLRVVFGEEEEVLSTLGKSTAYGERTHLTSRLSNSRLARKTLGYSKVLEMHRGAAAWEDLVYNLARPLKSLRCRVEGDSKRVWAKRTPAMAAGLTDHVWTIRELLTTVSIPAISNTKEGDYQPFVNLKNRT